MYRAALLLPAIALLATAARAAPPLGKEGVDWARRTVAVAPGKPMLVTATTVRPAKVPIPKVALLVDGKPVAGKEGEDGPKVSVAYRVVRPGRHGVVALCSGPATQGKIGATCSVQASSAPVILPK